MMISTYIKSQGMDHRKLYEGYQLSLF